MSNILTPEDPAFQRYERLVDALGTGPVHTAYESAALARIVAWASEDDCKALTRLVRKARRDAFEVGRTAGRRDATKGDTGRRLIVELGVILGEMPFTTGDTITVTLPNRLAEEITAAALELAPDRFRGEGDADGGTP